MLENTNSEFLCKIIKYSIKVFSIISINYQYCLFKRPFKLICIICRNFRDAPLPYFVWCLDLNECLIS